MFFEQTGRLIFCTGSSTRHKKRSTSSTCSYELEADDSVRWHSCIPNGGRCCTHVALCLGLYAPSFLVPRVDLGFERCLGTLDTCSFQYDMADRRHGPAIEKNRWTDAIKLMSSS